jgi:hypothetical protein
VFANGRLPGLYLEGAGWCDQTAMSRVDVSLHAMGYLIASRLRSSESDEAEWLTATGYYDELR